MKCTSCESREAKPEKKTCSFCLEKAKQRHKKRTDDLRAQGICLRCAQRPVEPGHVSCARCLTEDAEANLSRYHQRRDNGICVKCGKVPATSGTMCEPCTKKRRAWEKAREKRMAVDHLCRKCDNPVVPQKSLCEQHLNQARMASAARRKKLSCAGLCIGCGKTKPLPGRRLCSTCIDWQRKRDHIRRFGDPELRIAILRRDGMTCRICFETLSDSHLTIHHIDGSGQNEQPNNAPSNLITLCRRCHVTVHNTARYVKNTDLFLELVCRIRQPAARL